MNLANANSDEVEIARRVVSGEIRFTVLDRALDDFVTPGGLYGFKPVLAYVPPALRGVLLDRKFSRPAGRKACPRRG